MPISDDQFLEWTRGRISGPLTMSDHALSRDVRLCQLMLYTLCRYCNAKTIVEIGTADGSTTIPLLKAAEEMGGVVHSVDPAECHDAMRLVQAFGYSSFWHFHRETSEEFFSHFDEPIDLAFIDGDHRPDPVRLDIQSVFKLLKPNGFCVLHDWNPTDYKTLKTDRDPFTAGVAKGLMGVAGIIGPCHALPVWPHSREPDDGSEGMILILQKASHQGNLEFMLNYVWY